MNRKIIGLVLALSLTLLSGCGGKGQEEVKQENDTATVSTVADIPEETKEEAQEEPQEEIELAEVTELGEFGWRLPEGFIAYEDEPGIFVCDKYPKRIGCISYLIAGFDGNREEINEVIIKERLEKEILDNYAQTVEVTVNEFKEYDIDGCDTVRTEVSFKLLGAEYEQLQLLVYNETGAENYIINYIQEKGESYMDAFRRSADSISFQNE